MSDFRVEPGSHGIGVCSACGIETLGCIPDGIDADSPWFHDCPFCGEKACRDIVDITGPGEPPPGFDCPDHPA